MWLYLSKVEFLIWLAILNFVISEKENSPLYLCYVIKEGGDNVDFFLLYVISEKLTEMYVINEIKLN